MEAVFEINIIDVYKKKNFFQPFNMFLLSVGMIFYTGQARCNLLTLHPKKNSFGRSIKIL